MDGPSVLCVWVSFYVIDLVVVCAGVSLVLTYIHLCVEDWRWWWKAFSAYGSVAIHIFMYPVNYLVFYLKSFKWASLSYSLSWLSTIHASVKLN